jgi:uncharacterized phiE125 gp8 family phage protein
VGRVLATGPAVEPVSTSEAKAHLRITHSTDDAYIEALITVARRYAESHTKRALINQSWDLFLPSFAPEIALAPGPVSAITHVKYYDSGGTLQTLSSSVYQLDTSQAVGKITLAYNQSWPDIRSGLYNGVQIRFVAGYGAAGSNVPAEILHAIKILVSHWYEIREPVIAGGIGPVPMSVDALLSCQTVPEMN